MHRNPTASLCCRAKAIIEAIFYFTFVSAEKTLPWNHPQPDPTHNPPRRFAPGYSLEQVVQNPEPFIQDVLFWEGKFVQPGIGYNGANGLTYSGTLTNQPTGLALPNASRSHSSSAASRGIPPHHAPRTSPLNLPLRHTSPLPFKPLSSPRRSLQPPLQKLQPYLDFNRTYPSFEGFLSWSNNTHAKIAPTDDWVNRLPALDNGELV
ncbi:hypothetical protein M409DRAFT_59558 [Zasmidium cellare ATCC 36951]|uniref:Endo-beta-1,2-glucanase SGL domain-containing protein n=1 Tax=Zasmidium cellare ATCC 36951 TaxID=1080233 RepID=A0A6A6C423_ZASCE|nr:uncharacterized protein M409DRAFT_59558 [Zasmidium cellare ATCC 36951]KAF2161038.1 hypothetical protein M409DRAFT_59558 [Zasmidium cellare ATCC 36951]